MLNVIKNNKMLTIIVSILMVIFYVLFYAIGHRKDLFAILDTQFVANKVNLEKSMKNNLIQTNSKKTNENNQLSFYSGVQEANDVKDAESVKAQLSDNPNLYYLSFQLQELQLSVDSLTQWQMMLAYIKAAEHHFNLKITAEVYDSLLSKQYKNQIQDLFAKIHETLKQEDLDLTTTAEIKEIITFENRRVANPNSITLMFKLEADAHH